MSSGTSVAHNGTANRGMPGLRGGDHFGFTVPDMDEAVQFFRDVLGCREFYDLGEFGADCEWMTENLNGHPRPNVKSMRIFRWCHGTNI